TIRMLDVVLLGAAGLPVSVGPGNDICLQATVVSAGIHVLLHTGIKARRFGLADIDGADQVALVVKLTQTIDGIAALRILGG
ncbi:hypothetical protein, partial [Microbacterium lacticum]|uniref:hypothetical protein n=1 Tax=Microbacterium lacticum TaxID=33885 RepID=UPI001F56AC26